MEEYYGADEKDSAHGKSVCYPYKINRFFDPNNYLIPITSQANMTIKNRSREYKGFKLNRWLYPQSGSQHSDSHSPHRKTKRLLKTIKRHMNQTVVDKSTIFNNTKKSLATYDQNSLRNALREYSPNLTHKENFIIKVDAKLQLEKINKAERIKAKNPDEKNIRIQSFLSRLREKEAPKLISMLTYNNSTKNTAERLWDK